MVLYSEWGLQEEARVYKQGQEVLPELGSSFWGHHVLRSVVTADDMFLHSSQTLSHCCLRESSFAHSWASLTGSVIHMRAMSVMIHTNSVPSQRHFRTFLFLLS